MNNKLLLKYLSVIVFAGIIAFSGYRVFKGDGATEEYLFSNKEVPPVEEEKKEEEPVETEEEYVILTRVTYNDSYRTTIRLYSTGKLEQSAIKEATTASNVQKEVFVNIGDMSEQDLTTIKQTLDVMSQEKFKQDNFSESYGITIRLSKKDKILYSAEYFNQASVDILYNIIKKY